MAESLLISMQLLHYFNINIVFLQVRHLVEKFQNYGFNHVFK
jgi:hypothetical protein